MAPETEQKIAKIRMQNDLIRKSLTDIGKMQNVKQLCLQFQLVWTSQVDSLLMASGKMDTVLNAIACYDGFDDESDPYCEHEFGVVEVEGQTLYFKFDYYNQYMDAAAYDPSDHTNTIRVLTIMLSSEY